MDKIPVMYTLDKKYHPFYNLYNNLCIFIKETHTNNDDKDILNKAIELKNIVETYLENEGAIKDERY